MTTLTPIATPLPRFGKFSTPLASIGGILLLVPLIVMMGSANKFAEIFTDFGVQLPVVTQGFLTLNKWLITGPGITAAFFGVVLVFAINAIVARRRNAAILWFVLSLSAALLWLIVYGLAMYLPLMTMTESLKSGGTV